VVEPSLLERLRCPACREGDLTPGVGGNTLACTRCGVSYPVSAGRPLLLRPDNIVFPADRRVSVAPPRSGLARFVPSPSINLSRNSTLQTMRGILDRRGNCNILVVGSGRQRTWLTPLMQVVRQHDLVYTDVSMEADADIFCDAHDLPFADCAFDAVITTAVLEHVLYPEHVAAEIARVLKPEGLLYSELPFMQQVHEGAYDFTRYTLSGHRRLFRQFAELESGMVAGPATALVWSIENFALAFFAGRRSRLATKAVVRILFFWLKYFDHILAKRPEALDGASCTFFLGAKDKTPIADAEIIRGYIGAKYR
jgi:SAM-dependent methyltransferase